MADANDILGTSGKQAIPFEYQIEEQAIARQRALAQLMLQKGLKGPGTPERFGNHVARVNPLEHVANALSIYMGQKGLGDADASSQGLARRLAEGETADLAGVTSKLNGSPGVATPQEGPPPEGQSTMPPIMMGKVGPDTKGAIADAIKSRFSRVQAYGMDLQKNYRDQLNEQMKVIGSADPRAAVERNMTGNTMAPVPDLSAPPVEFTQDNLGNSLAIARGRKGEPPRVSYAPKPPSVTVNNGTKTDVELDKQQIDMLKATREDALSAPNIISNAIRVNDLMNQGADVGGGGSARQAVRKFGQAFGVDVPTTGLTEETRMRLGDSVLDKARKLAPVTMNDVELLKQLLGSIDTDPNALREINSLMLAKGLMTMDRHNAQVEETRKVSSGSPAKYDPFRVNRGNIDTKDGALLGRAYQLMKDSGHDMSGYSFDGKPVSEINFDVGFTKSSAGSKAPMPGSFRRSGQ